MLEIIDPRMLKIFSDDRVDFDRLTHSFDTGLETADAPNDQIYFCTRLRCFVEGLDDTWIYKRV